MLRMEPGLRMALTQSLILMRNRNQIAPMALLPLLFQLFRCPDKHLRKLLHSHLITDIKAINAKSRNNKLNGALQGYMYTMLRDKSSIAAKKSLDVLIELYKRKVWTDAKTVNVIADATLCDEIRIVVACLKFFLGVDEDAAEGSDDDEEHVTDFAAVKEMQHQMKVKGTMQKRKVLARAIKRQLEKPTKKHSEDNRVKDFSALQLIHDPQGFADKLFVRLRKMTGKFETRVMMMTLIARLIGIHSLLVLNFYPYVQRYIQPHQDNVTVLLAILAQACHDLVPPDVIEPVIKALTNNFISDRSSPEVMTVGINTVREICSRVPLAMDAALLQDLVLYKNSKHKSVAIAARGLLALYRDIDPTLLAKKDRGRLASTAGAIAPVVPYGASKALTQIPGVDLLMEAEAEEEEEGRARGDGSGSGSDSGDGWDLAERDEDDSSSGEWVDLGSDGEGDGNKDDDKLELPVDDDEIESKSSDSDDDDDEHDDDDDDDDEKEKPQEPPRPRKPTAAERILTPADFARIAELRAKRAAEAARGITKRKAQTAKAVTPALKRTAADANEPQPIFSTKDPGDRVDFNELLGPRKKAKMDYEARLAHIREGRDERSFSSKKNSKEKSGGTTNKQKLESKPFMLTRFNEKAERKKKMSFRDKQKVTQKIKETKFKQKKYKN
jgi:protein SDA1